MAQEPDFGEMNGFSDSVHGGGVRLDNDRLRLHFVGPTAVDLDLLYRPDGCWHGRFHRGAYDSLVTLCRPRPGRRVARSGVVGMWLGATGVGSTCVHITQAEPGTLVGWTDSVVLPGDVRFGPNASDHVLNEHYGILAKVHSEPGGRVGVEFGAYNGMCCSHLFVGELSADGKTLMGEFPAGPAQSRHAAVLTRVRGDNCMEAAEGLR